MGRLAAIVIPPAVDGRIAVVGVCGSGKSTLAVALRLHGYDARECAQEHSYIPDMWQRISRPRILVYLAASHSMVLSRLCTYVTAELYQEQIAKLAHAREHASIYVNTDILATEQVLLRVLENLALYRIEPGECEGKALP
jgi:ABC-type glutathione transport system ATPase component